MSRRTVRRSSTGAAAHSYFLLGGILELFLPIRHRQGNALVTNPVLRMAKYIAALIFISAGSLAWGQDNGRTYRFGATNDGLLPPARKDAYGPGLDSDAAGRPFYWAPKDQPQSPQSSFPDGTLRVKPDAYGLGVGMDQYGRPVERRPVR